MALTKISTGMLKQDAASSDLNIDAGTLYLDVSNNRVGINTTSPNNRLEISGGNIRIINHSTGRITFNNGSTEAFFGFNGAGSSTVDSGALPLQLKTQGSNHIRFDTNSSERMRIDSSGGVGINRTSIASSYKLHVGGDIAIGAGGAYGQITPVESGTTGVRISGNGSGTLRLASGGVDAMYVIDGGNVGIGTSSPNYLLDVEGTGATIARLNSTSGAAVLQISVPDTTSINDINFGDSGSTTSGQIRYRHNGDSLALSTAGTERMRIDSTGNLRVGVGNTFEPVMQFTNSGRVEGNPGFTFNGDLDTGMFNPSTPNTIAFANAGSESMRIDASGNVLIGTTSAYGTTGTTINAAGLVYSSSDGDRAGQFDRTTSDGEIVRFSKAGTTVGSIGVQGDRIYFAGANEAVGIDDSWGAFVPLATGGGNSDADTDLGNPSSRFKDLYLSGSVKVPAASKGIEYSVTSFITPENNTSGAEISTAGTLTVKTGSTPSLAMTVDVSGNLLVGTTDTTLYNNTTGGGAMLSNSGCGFAKETSGTGDPVVYFNNTGDDGQILDFRKGGTSVGNIGTNAGNIYLTDGARSLIVDGDTVKPGYSTGGNADNAQDLGSASVRWRNLYLSGVSYNGDGSASAPSISFGADTNTGFYRLGSDQIGFVTAGSLKAKLDASGNLLVGTTASAPQNFSSGSGTQISDGYIAVARGGAVALLNRVSTDGDIVEFKKDGSVVGSIGTSGGLLVIGDSDCGIAFEDGTTNHIYPWNVSGGAANDNAISLGSSSARYKDLYLSGTIAAGTGTSASTATISAYSRTVSSGLVSALRIIESTGASTYWDIGANNGSTPSLNFYVNANTSPKMTLAHSGNVGIGTASPSYKLDVRDGIVFAGRAVSDDGNISYTNTAAVFSSRGVDHDAARTNVLRLMRDGTSGVQYAGVADFDLESWESSGVFSRTAMTLKLGHGNLPDATDVMTWRSNGNVGIGTASPGFKLEIADDTNGAVDLLRLRNSDSTYSQTFDLSLDTGKNLSITGASSSGGIILKPGSYGTEIRRDAGGALGAKLTLRNFSNTAGSYVRLQLAPTQAGVDDRNVTIQGENVDGNNNMAMVFKTSAGASPAEAMRIMHNGNVGIGTTSPSETLTLDGDSLTTGTVFLGPNNGSRRPFAKASNWGYSASYRVAVLGSASNAYNTAITGSTTISFNYDPSGNSDGSFGGDGREILFRNGTQFVTPNDADNDFNLYNIVLKDGKVGIGTSSPSANLDVIDPVSGNFDGKIHIGGNGSNRRLILEQTDVLTYTIGGTGTSCVTRFVSGGSAGTGTEAMRIDSSGVVSIGNTGSGSASRLYVLGASTNNNVGVARFNTTGDDESSSCIAVVKNSSSTSTSNVFIRFGRDNFNNGCGQINANGASQAAFGSFSDRRLKENITDLPNQLASITALRPVEFDYIESEGGGHQIGFIAQEVEEIYPDLVGERDDGMKTLTGISKMEARLIKAIQEQNELINDLRARVAELEGE